MTACWRREEGAESRMNAVTEVMQSRRSIRRFVAARTIPRETLAEIIDCARLAPSGNNRQAWLFIVVTEREAREKIASYARYGRFIAEAPVCVCVFLEENRATTPVEDASAAAENIIIAAWSHGIGSCWVNSHHIEHAPRVRELLGVPGEYELLAMLALGYPAEPPGPIDKKGLAEVLHWEKF